MFRLNLLHRKTLIVPDEVIAKISSSHTIDVKRILGAIEIAEERFVRNAICREYYEELIEQKNVIVTADNINLLQDEVNTSFNGVQQDEDCDNALKVGDIVNSSSFLNDCNRKLWDRYLWKFVAECVFTVCLPENYFKLTSAGLIKANPEIPIADGGTGESVGLKINELKALMDIFLGDRVDVMREAMHQWVCDHKDCYPLYCKPCDCNSDGVAYSRKTDVVMGIYDEPLDGCGCPNPKTCGCSNGYKKNNYPNE